MPRAVFRFQTPPFFPAPSQDLVTEETRVKFDHVREQISKMQQILTDLLQVAHNIESRSTAFSLDMKQIAADLR